MKDSKSFRCLNSSTQYSFSRCGNIFARNFHCFCRDGHHGAPHLNKSNAPSASSKHGQAPPPMMNKPHHRDHKHAPPVRPSGNQSRSRDQVYPKREHMFAPPIRHSEPQAAPDVNHIGSVVNSGLNNSTSSVRKDNQQPHDVVIDHMTRDAKAMSLQVDPSAKRNQPPGFESSSRHNRVPATEGRVKEEVPSKMVPDVGHLYNNKHGVDHNRHRQFPQRQSFPPESAKPNVNEMLDRKPVEAAERKPMPAEHKPSVTEVVDRKPVIADISDRKTNINMHPAFSENRHESSSRRPPIQPYHQVPVKPEAIKKEEVTDFGGRITNASIRPTPPQPTAVVPPPPPPPPPVHVPQQPPPPPPPQSQSLPVPVHHSHHSQDRHKSSRSKSPTHSRSPVAPPRPKSPTPPNRRSDSPHGKVKSSVPLPPRNEEKPVVKRPEVPVISKLETVVPTMKLEVEESPVKAKPNAVTPEKAGSSVPKESRNKSTRQKTPPSSTSKKTPSTPVSETPTTPVSSFGSPPLPGSASKLRSTNRHRTSSSSSEPELVPVVKKLDEIRGYENIIRDSRIGIKIPNRVPDIILPIRDRNSNKKEEVPSQAPPAASSGRSNNVGAVSQELKLPDLIGPIATMRSSNTKPPSLPDDLGAVAFPESDSATRTVVPEEGNIVDVSAVEESNSNVEHHHKSEKKKKKKEHKHKDKDKSREERKHRHKHKDKDRHKSEKTEAAPIKITIPKDKIVNSILEPVKLKIMKDRLKDSDSTGSSPQSAPSGGLKIKISKDVISNFGSNSAAPAEAPSSSRKRDRTSPPPPGPPSKSARLNTSAGDHKRNVNNYGKQNGVEHHRRGSHYSGNKVGPRYSNPPPLPMPYQPYPHPHPQYYQYPPPPHGMMPPHFMYGYYGPPAPFMYQPPLQPQPHHHPPLPPPLPEGPPPDDNPPPPPPPE